MTELLNVSDVVKMLQVPEGTIYRWIKQGDIPYIERSGIYIFNKSTLETWAASKHILLKNNQFNDTNNEKNLNSYNSTLIKAILAGNVFKNINCSSVENFFFNSLARFIVLINDSVAPNSPALINLCFGKICLMK